jgi:hypothetical protein
MVYKQEKGITMKLHAGSISQGTLKLDALLCAFANALALHDHARNKKLIREAMAFAKDMRDGEKQENVDQAVVQELMDELSQKLDELCPRGHYFGASKDDETNFGVWEYHEDDYDQPLDKADYEASMADFDYQMMKEQEDS